MAIKVSKLVWQYFKRGTSEKLVLLRMADLCDTFGERLFPSIQTIARDCSLSEKQARRIVHSLIDGGYLEVVGNAAGGAPGTTRRYRLKLDRLTGSERPTNIATAPMSGSRLNGVPPPMDGSPTAPKCDLDDSHECPETAPMGGSQAVIEPLVNAPVTAAHSFSTSRNATSPRRLPEYPACPLQAIVDAYHEGMPNNPRVKILNSARKSAIAARWREASQLACRPFDGGCETQKAGIAKWREFFTICARSAFLTGHATPQSGRPPFVADIDFLMSPTGFTRCLENKYHRESA